LIEEINKILSLKKDIFALTEQIDCLDKAKLDKYFQSWQEIYNKRNAEREKGTSADKLVIEELEKSLYNFEPLND